MGSAIACALLLIIPGCRSARTPLKFRGDEKAHYEQVATDIEYPAVQQCSFNQIMDVAEPRDLEAAPPEEFWDLSLEEAIAIALQNTDVLKDVGGRVLTTPDTVPTVYDPAIQEADPRFGPEGALSAFDAHLSSELFWSKNDRVFNNPIDAGTTEQQYEFQQDFASLDTEISKRTATGARFSVRSFIDFDRNNANETNKLFLENWDSQLDFTLRQPLLQGRGSVFNRIAGPDAQPGFDFTAGVLIARINTDVSLADFDAAVIRFVAEVERAYWELYFAYRDLDAAVLARDQALETWQTVKAKYENNLRGGEAYQEARARGQYYLFQDQVQDALNGVLPTSGGTTARSVGVYAGERRLRWLMGLPTTEDRMIRPIDEPSLAKVTFDWGTSIREAVEERVELRRQRWQIKRYELQLIAARNFVLPRLDTVALYRVRGFGKNLVDDTVENGTAEQMRFASAFKDLGTFDHQEWEAGLQLEIPLGYRQGWAGVRQSELQLSRSRAVLREQEDLVMLELSDSFAEATRAYAAVRANYERLTAAQQDRLATKIAYEADQISVDLLLESQQRLAESQRQYFRSLSNYALSLMEVHIRKGTLLPYNNIYLSEGPWPRKAYRDAAEFGRRWKPKRFSSAKLKPGVVSLGHFEAELQAEDSSADGTVHIDDGSVLLPEALPTPDEQRSPEPADSSLHFPLNSPVQRPAGHDSNGDSSSTNSITVVTDAMSEQRPAMGQ
jgi:outer membrane protein TolC